MPDAKKFRLSLVNAAEDVPRLIRGYGRACDGEFALVLRPAEERGVLVLVKKKEGAWFWRGPASPLESSDAPGRPEATISAADAVALVKAEQKAVPKPGPITLRGQWSGQLVCDGGAPRVELARKLASYGTLKISSDPGVGWTWRVEREEKWFSKPGSDVGTAKTLLRAIEAGLARAMGLLGEACSVRDSRRRAALDTDFAASHPVKPAVEGKDPIDRFKPKEPRRKPPVSGGWTHYAHDDEAPEADPIDRPSRTVLAKVRGGGLKHDAGAGTFLGRTIEAFHGFPAGSLVFRQPEDNAGFYLHGPVEEQPRTAKPPAEKPAAKPGKPAGRPKAPAVTPAPSMIPSREGLEVDAAKDKALIDAFSAAVAAAMGGA
jgi:hypothetical protein